MKQSLSERMAKIQMNYTSTEGRVDVPESVEDSADALRAASGRNSPESNRVRRKRNAEMAKGRLALRAINARGGIIVAADEASLTSGPVLPAMPTVAPMIPAQPTRAPKHRAETAPAALTTVTSEEVPDEERQYEIDQQRGFSVINMRKRSRDELLNTPLEELEASINPDELTQNRTVDPSSARRRNGESTPVGESNDSQESAEVAGNKPPTSVIDMYYAALAESEREEAAKAVNIPAKPDRDPIIQNYTIPPKPDHDPTIHLTSVDEKQSLKDALRHPFAYLSGQLDAARAVLRSKRTERSSDDEHLAKRNKIIKRTLGVVGVAMAGVVLWKLGYDTGVTDGIGSVNVPAGVDTGGAAREEAARQAAIAAQHEAILNSPVHNIPLGGGGEAYAAANGADASIWYQNQVEFLQLFPSEAHLMPDGNVGFDRPGELSDQAKEYWAKKFGLWR
jgi:hypothetical protein